MYPVEINLQLCPKIEVNAFLSWTRTYFNVYRHYSLHRELIHPAEAEPPRTIEHYEFTDP